MDGKTMRSRTSSMLKGILLLLAATGWICCCAGRLGAYVSPGNFYELGELSVQVINVPDTIAPVELDIYTPVASDSYPVILFQHGFTGSIKGYETISAHLASHGFVTVLPQMYPPGGGGTVPTPEEEAVLGVQIISWLEENINSLIPVTANTALLGLAGHSRGGQIAYRMALQVTEKVKALAGVDPVDGLVIFGQTLVITGPLSFDIPTYILGTGLGPIVVGGFLACAPADIGPYHFFGANPPPSWLMEAKNNGHADMIDEEDYTEFCPGGPNRDGMRAFTAGTLAAFFSGILQQNGSALVVLTDTASAPVPAIAEATVFEIAANASCTADNDFNQGENVYGKAVLGLMPNTAYPLHIVDHRPYWSDNMTIPLSCTHCTSPPEASFTTDGNGDMGCGTLLWQNAQTDTRPSYFDIIVDINNNGFFDAGADFLDANTVAGFEICLDTDGDSLCNDEDNCPAHANPDGADAEGDGIGNTCDICWTISNPDQLDTNGNCPAPPYASDPKCGDACNVCMADFDNNGKTNLTDLGILKGEFGRTNCRTVPPACRADTNADGKVNLTDLGKLKSEFGKTNCFQ